MKLGMSIERKKSLGSTFGFSSPLVLIRDAFGFTGIEGGPAKGPIQPLNDAERNRKDTSCYNGIIGMKRLPQFRKYK